ncbi:MAG: hypothetical protein A2032_02875 [Chloroflexi bacterium RBG_19FT_COMBO_49_13]|nr:MAG: hypothetical protein A2032_02875 [Chloroflexi bacterium RBG_19FT_COMBO_49_13]
MITFTLSPLDITGPSAPYLLLVFGLLALFVVNLLLALVEGVILTLLSWNPFRTSMTVALFMNIASGIVNGILLILLQRTPFVWLPISFILSIIIEAFVLTYFKRDAFRQNIMSIFLVNLASYILLILPAYYFGSHP